MNKLQEWYFSQCDDEWEHEFGVKIETLDNPGWSVIIDLENTDLESLEFTPIKYGIGEGSEPKDNHWLDCQVIDNHFKGYGGPFKLEEIIKVFLNWANTKN